MRNILSIITFITIISFNACAADFSKDDISKKVVYEVERTLSIQLSFGLHTFPENTPIAVKMANFKESDKLYFVLIDYPVEEQIDNKYVYVVTNEMGKYEHYKRYKVKFLGNFFKQDIKSVLKKDYIEKEISLSKDKANEPTQLSDEIIKQNEKNIQKLYDSIMNYFTKNPDLSNKYGKDLILELAIDADDLIVESEFVVTKIYSDMNKDGLYGWVYCKDDNKKPLDKFRFEKVKYNDGWTKKIRNENTIKTYKLTLDK